MTIACPNEEIPVHWYGLSLATRQDFIATLGRGATNQTELSKDDVAAIRILLPAQCITADFEAQAENIFRQIMTLTGQSEQLAKARDLLLPRLMDGRLEI